MSLDLQGAMARLGNDASLFVEFIGFYHEDSPRLLHALRTAVQQRDAEAIHHTAHSFKGLVASLGATDVVSAANALERMGKSRDLSEAGSALEKLESALLEFEQKLEDFRSKLEHQRADIG